MGELHPTDQCDSCTGNVVSHPYWVGRLACTHVYLCSERVFRYEEDKARVISL